MGGVVLGCWNCNFFFCFLLAFFLFLAKGGASGEMGGLSLCLIVGGASGETCGLSLCPNRSGAAGFFLRDLSFKSLAVFFFLWSCVICFFLCPIKGGASGETRSGASEGTRAFFTSVVGSAMSSAAEQIGLKKGDLHGGGGREGVVIAPKYTNATGS